VLLGSRASGLLAAGGMKVSLDDLLQEVDAAEESKRLATLRASMQASREQAADALFGKEAAQLPGTSKQVGGGLHVSAACGLVMVASFALVLITPWMCMCV
jgi:Flp pilus assembly protein TadB